MEQIRYFLDFLLLLLYLLYNFFFFFSNKINHLQNHPKIRISKSCSIVLVPRFGTLEQTLLHFRTFFTRNSYALTAYNKNHSIQSPYHLIRSYPNFSFHSHIAHLLLHKKHQKSTKNRELSPVRIV